MFPLPLCHSGQTYVRLCSTPMALQQCLDTCSSPPCKPISRGEGSRERKAVSPSLLHMQCSVVQKHWCRPWQLFLSPVYRVPLKKVHPITSIPYFADRGTGNDLLRDFSAEQKQDWVYNSHNQVLCLSERHPASTPPTHWEGFLKPSAKHREVGICNWGLWGLP